MGLLEITELVLGVLLALLLVCIGFVLVRRHLIADGKPLMLCALRTPAKPEWRLGLLRFGGQSLAWFTIFGPALRPATTWNRSTFQLGPPAPSSELVPVLGEALTAPASDQGGDFEIAMQPAALTAMRAWMESSPPGSSTSLPGQFT